MSHSCNCHETRDTAHIYLYHHIKLKTLNPTLVIVSSQTQHCYQLLAPTCFLLSVTRHSSVSRPLKPGRHETPAAMPSTWDRGPDQCDQAQLCLAPAPRLSRYPTPPSQHTTAGKDRWSMEFCQIAIEIRRRCYRYQVIMFYN